MNKKARLSLVIGSSALVIGACTIPTITTTIASSNVKSGVSNSEATDTNKLLLPSIIDGKYVSFDSIDDAMNKIYGNSKIQPVNFIGDFNSAVNPNNNAVNPERGVYKYNASKILDAFKTAKGQYTSNKLEATESYLWDTGNQYMDAVGNLHENLSDAQNANDDYKRKQTIGVEYYLIDDKSNGLQYKINPLNQKDIDYFKKIAIRNLGIENSQFKVSPIIVSNLGQMNSTDILSSFSRDDIVDAVYKILHYLSKYINELEFSANITLNDWVSQIENQYKIQAFPGSQPGITWYEIDKSQQYVPGEDGYSIGSIEYYYSGNVNTSSKSLDLKEIKNEDFVDAFLPFIDTGEFNKTFLKFADVRHNKLLLDAYWDDCSTPCYMLSDEYLDRFKANFVGYNLQSSETPIFQIRANLSGLSPVESYRFQSSLMEKLDGFAGFKRSGTIYSVKSFVVKGKTDLSEITNKEVKSKIIKDLSDIIYENLIFKNTKIASALPDEEIYKNLKSGVDQIATFVYDSWTEILSSWEMYQNSPYVRNFGYDFEKEFEESSNTNSYTREQMLTSTTARSWWISGMSNNDIFGSLVFACQNILNQFAPAVYKNSLLISFNGAPVFLISDMEALKIENASLESIALIEWKLNNWLSSSDYNPSLIVNVSDKVSFFDETYTFGLKTGALNHTLLNFEVTNPVISQLYRYEMNYNENTISELTQGQNLLLTDIDSYQLLRNDLGIASALYLYNKNINKILDSENPNVYLESIDQTDIATTNVLRLYNKITEKNYNGDYLSAYHTYPTYYGEIRAKIGTFNPSIYDKYVMSYKNEIESITSDIAPLEVPIVRINGSTYILAKLANPETTIITGKIEELVVSASRRLVQYMKPSNEFIFYNNSNNINEDNLMLINNQVKQIVEYNLELGMINPEVFDGHTNLYFLSKDDGDVYLRDKVRMNAIYQSNK